MAHENFEVKHIEYSQKPMYIISVRGHLGGKNGKVKAENPT